MLYNLMGLAMDEEIVDFGILLRAVHLVQN
jgi:hypothetical protein